MKLSVIIPAFNEENCLEATLDSLYSHLNKHEIDYDIIVVNDGSTDKSELILKKAQKKISNLKYYNNAYPRGFGYAVRYGLEHFTGDCVVIMMADLSDDPEDIIRFYDKMKEQQYDCIFGHRFTKGGKVTDYPIPKLMLNRFANSFVRLLFNFKYGDITNAFKMYKKETIDGLKPFLSTQFNLTLELPLKAIIRGYTYTVLPNSWTNRKFGISKFKIKELGSKYFLILIYCLIEKYFSYLSKKKKI
ncbi:family 2 glycosyl transferase [Candidatus Magnetobacterium bavaricum]|uniref:Family 2 glycosyl transferase n=1 Tax=Candidatus Magnetobacterium bavaricum TaxID=29290 RepID=A0A0F3GHJ7_9BACT|nr:family 2 glycosyl transferase [Candidatus Magnetobacterium bavaricum]